jgi:adenylate cyclase
MSSQSLKRKLAAILSADVKGYSLLMAKDEAATVRTLIEYRESIAILIQKHLGRVVDATGDNILAEFPSVVDTVKCAVKIQEILKAKNAELPEDRRMDFRIGVNLGDIIEEEDRIYGDGVNIAARLEGLAEGGGICVSGTAFDQVKNKLSVGYQYLGNQTVKNIPDPVRAYKVLMEPKAAGKVIGEKEPKQTRWGWKAVVAVAVLVLVAGGLVWNFYWRAPQIEPASVSKMALPLPDKPSIAVLPFVNMSDDPQQEYLSDGITEDLITDLSKISGLLVIARDSVFTYKGKSVKVDQVSRELGVRYIVEGSVRKEGEKVRITAQLVDATTGGHVWAERYDRDLKDVFDLQDEITQRIVAALEVKVMEVEQERVMRKATTNLNAYDYALRGRWYSYHYSKESNIQARQMYEKAIALDPAFAMAYAGLAWTYYEEWANQWNQNPQSLERASELAKKAVALGNSLPSAHRLLGHIYLLKRQYEEAIAEQEEAVKLDPNNADSYASLADVLTWAGSPQRAIGLVEKAMRLNPYYQVPYLFTLGNAYLLTGEYEKGIATQEEALTRNPDFLGSHLILAEIYTESGRTEDAHAQVAEVLRISPNYSLEMARETLPFKDQAQLEHSLSDLRKAGLS